VILDYQTDDGRELHRLAKLYVLPAELGQVKLAELQPPANLGTQGFADDLNRLYPCFNRASTLLSSLYFLEKRGEIRRDLAPRVADRLNRAIHYFDLEDQVNQFERQYEANHKQAAEDLADSDFALVIEYDDQPKQRMYPLRNATEVKAAADYLYRYRDQIPWDLRHTMAERIADKADEHLAALGSLESFVHKQAGHGVGRPSDIVKEIRARSVVAKKADMKSMLQTLAAEIEARPAELLTNDRLVKLAGTLEAVDRSIGLTHQYDLGWRRPEDVLFAGLFKQAAEEVKDLCPLLSGTTYSINSFARLPLDRVRETLGDQVANGSRSGFDLDTRKFADIARTLPLGDAELLDRLLQDVGIEPVGHVASAALHEVPDEQLWSRLADVYERNTTSA
jgi:hypothetical protein